MDVILEQVPEIPVWPQLSAYPAEQMMVQYLEGLPGVRRHEGRVWIQTDDADLVVVAYGSVGRIGVKMAPGVPHAALPADCHAQWTSVDGDLVEAALWTLALAPEGPGRSARVIRAGRSHMLDEGGPAWPGSGSPAANAPVRQAPDGPIGAIVAEPDPAVIRSGLVARLAENLGARLVSPGIAWLTGDDLAPTPFATRFEVLDVVPLRVAAIDRALASLDIGSVEVKKRGADVDPHAIRAALHLTGTGRATVIATRVQGRHRAIIARRLLA